MTSGRLVDSLTPLLRGDVSSWTGLGDIEFTSLVEAFGEPEEVVDSVLGVEPARRARFTGGGGFTAYVRAGHVVMIEADLLPEVAVLEHLPAPCATLPEEIYVEDCYAHEVLFCDRGLLLTVVEHLVGERTKEIMRSRGIKSLESPDDLGTDLYVARDSDINWQTRAN